VVLTAFLDHVGNIPVYRAN